MNNEAVLSSPIHVELLQKYDALSRNFEALEIKYNNIIKLVNGFKQERFISTENPLQPTLFSLPVTQAAPEIALIKIERKKPEKKKDIVIAEGKRLPEHLRREVVEILPTEDISECKRIGVEVSEQLQFKPGEIYIKETHRPKFAKPNGEGIIIADMPVRIKEKSILGNSLLAKITTDKYVYHNPLYRQNKQMLELGINIAVSTLTDGVAYVCDAGLPLYEYIAKTIFKATYLQVDETPIKVLDPKVKGKAHMGYMWVYRAPQLGLVYFDYRPSRSREGPQECLKDYEGYLQTDGYSAYDSFGLKPGITLVGCMAHARRKFFDAQKNDRDRAVHVLTEMGKVYKIEDDLREKNATSELRYQTRQKEAKPILDALKEWLDKESLTVQPKSTIGQAMGYCIPRWDKLTNYLNAGILEIDNNMIENAIRPVALGRKNFLFAGSHEGAKRAAIMYTFYSMCKINDVHPMQWLEKMLDQLPSHSINHIGELLPKKQSAELGN